jgi:hypothetical protein
MSNQAGRIAYFDRVNALTLFGVVNMDGMRIPTGHLVPNADNLRPPEIELSMKKFRNTCNEESEAKMLDIFIPV